MTKENPKRLYFTFVEESNLYELEVTVIYLSPPATHAFTITVLERDFYAQQKLFNIDVLSCLTTEMVRQIER